MSAVGRADTTATEATLMTRRRPPEPDLSAFAPVLAAALKAYASDPEYAVQMATRAVVVLEKRATWSSRKIVRDAEAAARKACSAAGSFSCDNTAPCGVGAMCRFSSGPLRDLELPEAPKLGPTRGGRMVERPQLASDGTRSSYNSEVAVIPHRDQQEGSLRPA